MASIYVDFGAADTGPERIGNSLEYNGEGEQTTLIHWWRMDAFYCRAVRHF